MGSAAAAAWVINLDRRPDRLESFRAENPPWVAAATRWPAVDGRALTMNADLATQLAPNNFFWKKAVAGCALSHIGLWKKLVADSAADYYVIFEDDARVTAPALEITAAPPNFDVIYLGGILPHNRPTVNRALASVGPGVRFIQTGPTIHFCAYAYVLSRRGAEKLLAIIERRGGIYSSLDLIMCQNAAPEGELDVYAFNPMIAGCSQDDDPVYVAADFNNMTRVDNFDSDIWTNDVRWSEAEYGSYVRAVPAWAKKIDITDINPGILNGIIAGPQIPVVVGPLPPELVRAIPLQECIGVADAWRLIEFLEGDAVLREKYRKSLQNSIGIVGK